MFGWKVSFRLGTSRRRGKRFVNASRTSRASSLPRSESDAGPANIDTALGSVQILLYGRPGAGGLTPMSKAISSHFQ